MKTSRMILSMVLVLTLKGLTVAAQPEVMAWGNITGIRVDGQMISFESGLRVAAPGWTSYTATGKELQKPQFYRDCGTQTVITTIGSIKFVQSVDDCGKGCADVNIRILAGSDTLIEGVFFCISISEKDFPGAELQYLPASSGPVLKMQDLSPALVRKEHYIKSKGCSIASGDTKLTISSPAGTKMCLIRREPGTGLDICFSLTGGKLGKGESFKRTFSITATCKTDNSAAEIILDSGNPGRLFEGLGGNFRLQNPSTDPLVIDYCLKNMRVAWGRVELPWYLWQIDENTDPMADALAGKLHPHVKESMEMAQRLAGLGMPVIVSDWGAPAWAILGDPMDAYRNRSKGIYGYQLNPEKTDKIYKSIGQYLLWLKREYGVEAALFSFNESDLGINVRHTGKEHAEFIKGFGAYLASIGLSTKLLLGDNSDANTFGFILPAMKDPDTYRYIGAISFHSWRGCSDDTLKKWADAASQMNLPLLVGEGSTDAAAWNYPAVFSEESFALNEINLYTRLLAICQPLSILQWQLTADYSVLTGEGIFGTAGPLHPTQRFWNLKQLSFTPGSVFSIPVKSSRQTMNCAAFSNRASNTFALHIVNNGARCPVIIRGIPPGIRTVGVFYTNRTRNMEKTASLEVTEGSVEFILGEAGFTSLISY